MSSSGFHVHGPHDHEIEHAAQAGHGAKDPFASRTAVITTVPAHQRRGSVLRPSVLALAATMVLSACGTIQPDPLVRGTMKDATTADAKVGSATTATRVGGPAPRSGSLTASAPRDTGSPAQQQPGGDNSHGLGIAWKLQDGNRILQMISGRSPLVAVGIKPGDVLTHVDGQALAGLSEEAAVRITRGGKDTRVRLAFERTDPLTKGKVSLDVVVPRIKLENATWADLFQGLKPVPNVPAPVLDPVRSAAEAARGRAALESGKAREAIDHLERATALSPDNAEVRLRLAEAYVALGMLEPALAALDQLTKAREADLSPESAAEKAALLRGLRVEVAARDADPTIDQAERIRRQSDRAACATSPDLDCMVSHARNAILTRPATGGSEGKVDAKVELAKLLAKGSRRDAALAVLEEARQLARTVQPNRSYLIRPAELEMSELLARVAVGYRDIGAGDAAARTAQQAIATALNAGPYTESSSGRIALTADQARSKAINEVASTFARAGAVDFAERALEPAIGLSERLLQIFRPNGLALACSHANVQPLSYVRPHYGTPEQVADVLGRHHDCRFWTVKHASYKLVSLRRYLEAIVVLSVLNGRSQAAAWAELAGQLGQDGFWWEATSAGAAAMDLYRKLTDATIGQRTDGEFTPSSDFVRAVENIAMTGRVAETNELAARMPDVLRADPSNSYLDAAGLQKRIDQSRADQIRNLVTALTAMGLPDKLNEAKEVAATLPADASAWVRESIEARLATAEARLGDLDAAVARLRATPKAATSASYPLLQAAATAGRRDLMDAIAELTSSYRSAIPSMLFQAGRFDDALALDPHAGTTTSATQKRMSDPKHEWRYYSFTATGQPLAELRLLPMPTFSATPASATTAFRQGFALASANAHHGAVDLFRAGLAATPTNAAGHFYLAESLFQLARYDEARKGYERARTLAAGSDEGRLSAGVLMDFDARVAAHRNALAEATRRNSQIASQLAQTQQQLATLQGAGAAQAIAAEYERRQAEGEKRIREASLKSLAVPSLQFLGYYDGGEYAKAALAKGEMPDFEKSPLFRQALSAWQQSRTLPVSGQLSVDVAEKIEGEMDKLLTWGSACFRQSPEQVASAKRGDIITRSVIMGQAYIAMRACQAGNRLNASSCQVCAIPPAEMRRPGEPPLFVEK